VELSGNGFNTFQSVAAYESALRRHGQWVRWTRAVVCPCLSTSTNQPSPSCSLCKGRGRVYTTPDRFTVSWESAKHNNMGKVFPKMGSVVVGSVSVFQRGVELPLASVQPADGSYVQLAAPFPAEWELLNMRYDYSPIQNALDETPTVIATNVLKISSPTFQTRGRWYVGSIRRVRAVTNITKNESYTVSKYEKDFIFLSSMGTYTSGDELLASYDYVLPFSFIVTGISQKMRYEKPYILDEASAQLITPYYCKVSPDDLLTALSKDQYGTAIVDPTLTVGNDVLNNYFDVVRITRIVDLDGVEHDVDTEVTLVGRNEISWVTAKPTKKYSVQFFYNPTYIALRDYSSMRVSENKEFVNKINLMQYDMINAKRTF